MTALWTALLLIGTSIPPLADVTKEEVRRLLEAHVSDQTVIAFVQKHGPMEPLSIEDLAELKNAGASDDLLRALLAATRPSDAVTPAPATNTYSSGSPTVIYDTPQYYYYPYYVPSYAPYYPSSYFSYSSYPYRYYPYKPYPYRYYPYRSYPSTVRPYPYSHYYGNKGTYVPHTTVPRSPVRPGGLHPYRATPPPQVTAPPRATTSPPPATRPAPPPRPAQPAPRGRYR